MMQWFKRLFRSERKEKTTMVEVLRDLWDIDQNNVVHEEPPESVDTDIYHVQPREKPMPHRSSRRKKKYKPLK